MTRSKITFKRARPLLGTFFEIKIYAAAPVFSNDPILRDHTESRLTQIFESAANLESLLSIFIVDSDISRLNRAPKRSRTLVSKIFSELLQLAFQIENFSERHFTCFPQALSENEKVPFSFVTSAENEFWIQKNTDSTVDLNGIAKGFIVDQIADNLIKTFPQFSGVINAGGDLRYFNEEFRESHVRVGNPKKPISRKLSSSFDSLATSSLTESQNNPRSKTFYRKILRAPLNELSTVTVLANSCAVADGLTKVALFAPISIIEKCAHYFKAQILTFDEYGTLIESIGAL